MVWFVKRKNKGGQAPTSTDSASASTNSNENVWQYYRKRDELGARWHEYLRLNLQINKDKSDTFSCYLYEMLFNKQVERW